MTRKKDKEYKIPIVCTGCYEEVDRFKLRAAIKAKQTFVHHCGKVLHLGEGENDAVPKGSIANPDDLSLSDTSESESAGDA